MAASSSSCSSSTSPLSIFSPKIPLDLSSCRALVHIPPASKGKDDEFDLNRSISGETSLVPIVGSHRGSLLPLSQDTAMGLVLSAATGKGWTTGSGMEGPSEPAGDAELSRGKVSTFPWSLFTKSPRRRMLVAFTCNICKQRTTRAVNPHAYTEGTVFVQCCGCNAYHKLVDHLNLFQDMKCYINPSFNPGGGDVKFEYRDADEDDDGDGDGDGDSDDDFFRI